MVPRLAKNISAMRNGGYAGDSSLTYIRGNCSKEVAHMEDLRAECRCVASDELGAFKGMFRTVPVHR